MVLIEPNRTGRHHDYTITERKSHAYSVDPERSEITMIAIVDCLRKAAFLIWWPFYWLKLYYSTYIFSLLFKISIIIRGRHTIVLQARRFFEGI